MRRTGFWIAAALVATTLSACGTTEPSSEEREDERAAEREEQAAAEGEAAPEPITLTDDLGRTVELPGPAQDVVSLEWAQTEMLLTLGVEPVGVADPEGYATWDSAEALAGDGDALDVGMRGEVNKNAVLEKDPDLIVAVNGGNDLELFEDSGIPILMTDGGDAEDAIGHMRGTFELLAQATGTEDVATDVLAELDASIEEASTAIEEADPATRDFVYADAYVQGSTLSIRPFGQGSLVGELGEAAGLTNVWDGTVDEAYGLGQADVEAITAVDDAWFLYTGTESDDWLKALEGNRLWDESTFVTDDRVVAFTPGIWTFGGPRSAEQVLDGFVEAVSAG